MKSAVLVVIIFSVGIISCSKNTDPNPAIVNMMPGPPVTTNPSDPAAVDKTGVFTSYAHNLMGSATLHVDSVGMKLLRLDDYTMSQGPDVRVYLSKSNNYGNANVIEISRLADGYNKSELRIDISSFAYTPEHKFVLIYCLQYNSLFGFAELK